MSRKSKRLKLKQKFRKTSEDTDSSIISSTDSSEIKYSKKKLLSKKSSKKPVDLTFDFFDKMSENSNNNSQVDITSRDDNNNDDTKIKNENEVKNDENEIKNDENLKNDQIKIDKKGDDKPSRSS